MRAINSLILKCFGWSAIGYTKLYSIPKFIIAIGPHTSNWDFVLGILVRNAFKLEKIKFLGKESLFRPPFGFIFKFLGGHPIIRKGHQNQVDSYIQAFKNNHEFAIVIAPEGTRKNVDRLKTGYYYMAKGAEIPIIPTIMNYKTKTVYFGDPFYPSHDEKADLQALNEFFSTNVGKYPELCYNKVNNQQV